MAYRKSIRAVFFTVILVTSAFAGSIATVGAAVGSDSPQSTNTGEMVTGQLPSLPDRPTPEGTVNLNKSGAGIDVLIDASHHGSSLTAFASVLRERGFDVDTKMAGTGKGLMSWKNLPTDGLSDYDVVVIPTPQSAYSDAELEKLHTYVRNGGALFVVGHWTSPLQGRAKYLNAIIDRYGLHFNGETAKWLRNIQDPTNTTVEDYDWRVLLHNTVDHPITKGISRVEYDGVSINVTDRMGTQAPLLYGDKDTYEYTYSTTEKKYHRGRKIVGAAATWNIGQNGRVVAFGSQKTLSTYLKESWQEGHKQTDSRKFLLRTMKWLAAAGHLDKPEKPVAVRGITIEGGEVKAFESIVIRNKHVAYAIGTETKGPFGVLPGGIFDAAAYGMTTDKMGVAAFAANNFGSWINYTSFETKNASSPDGQAVVTATGHLKGDTTIEVTTKYVLAADAKHVWINTTITNTGDTRFPANESKQALSGVGASSESLSTWLPGIGDNEAGRYSPGQNPKLLEPWASLSGDRVTYGIWGADGDFEVYTASTTWVDPWLQHSLTPSESEEINFAFFVGASGGTSSVSEYYAKQHGKELGTVTGTVETSAGAVVPKATVVVSKNGEPYTYTVGTQDGEYSLQLPPGEYTLQADAKGFGPSEKRTVTVTAGKTSTVRFTSLQGPAPVHATVKFKHDGTVEPTDARITVKTQGGTTVRTVYTEPLSVGHQTFRLPPGDYTLVFNHGTNYIADPVRKNITVNPGEPVNVTATITEKLDPSERNWAGAETHAHSGVSFDGKTPVKEFLAVQHSSGVDMIAISDHNLIGAWGTLSSQAKKRGIPFLRSEEITTGDLGHMNPYPMHGDTVIDSKGTIVEFIKEARKKHNAIVFQINHPGDRFIDLTKAPGQEEKYLPMVDAIEAYNGPYGESDANSVQGLFNLWNKGYDIAAVGVSDDHNGKAFPTKYGTARTRAYVEGKLTPDKFAKAVKDGNTYATYGPALQFTVSGEIPGETVTTAIGSTVEVSATVRNLDELAYAHVIRNGTLVANVTLDGTKDTISRQVSIDGNAWISLRVVDVEGDHALTSPVWIDATEAQEGPESAVAAIAGADDVPQLSEVQTAIDYWLNDTPVPGTDGQTLSFAEIQTLLDAWMSGHAV